VFRANCRRLASYPAIDEPDMNVWAWNFLRRNPQYCQDWQRFVRECEVVKALQRRGWMWSAGRWVYMKGKHVDLMPIIGPLQATQARLSDKWQLHGCIVSPYENDPGPVVRRIAKPDPVNVICKSSDLWAVDQPSHGDPNKALFEIDLTGSLKTIARRIIEELKGFHIFEHDKTAPRNLLRPENFRDYLRVLDGYADGLTNSKLATIIFPSIHNSYPDLRGNKRVDNHLASATRLRNRGYRFLP